VYTGMVSLDTSLQERVNKSLHVQHRQPDFFEKAPVGVAFKNGFVGSDGKLVALSADHRQLSMLPWDYMPEVSLEKHAPLFHRTLHQWFDPSAEMMKEAKEEEGAEAQQNLLADAVDKIQCISEFAGLCIIGGFGPSRTGRANIHTAVLNLGEGHNGKSVFREVLSEMVPKEYQCSVPPQDMAGEYNRDNLAGKRLNSCPDIPEGEIINTGWLKAILGGDSNIPARRIYHEPYEFQPIAGHIFNANTLPRFKDTSLGFRRRWIIINWENTVSAENKIGNLSTRLLAEEGSAIASWFVQCGLEAFTRKSLTKPASSDIAMQQWAERSEMVAEYVTEALNKLDASCPQRSWPKVEDLYRWFKTWAPDAGHRNLPTKREFMTRLRRATNNSLKKQDGSWRAPYDKAADKNLNDDGPEPRPASGAAKPGPI
jgi:P4 family phage/plasmid primase-like protien